MTARDGLAVRALETREAAGALGVRVTLAAAGLQVGGCVVVAAGQLGRFFGGRGLVGHAVGVRGTLERCDDDAVGGVRGVAKFERTGAGAQNGERVGPCERREEDAGQHLSLGARNRAGVKLKPGVVVSSRARAAVLQQDRVRKPWRPLETRDGVGGWDWAGRADEFGRAARGDPAGRSGQIDGVGTAAGTAFGERHKATPRDGD